MLSHGIGQIDGYITQIELEDAQGRKVGIRASHRYQNCYRPQAAAADPTCAAPVPLAQDAYSLPSCGLLRFRLAQADLATQLRSLTYIDNEPTAFPQDSARRWRNGAAFQARIQVYGDRSLTAESAVSDWLKTTGADAIIGSRAEELLTAAFQDPKWRDFIADQRASDATPGPFQRAVLVNDTRAARCTLSSFRRFGTAAPARAAACGLGSWLDGLLSGASAKGDPHIVTYDGLAYDFQGAGEYILATSTNGDKFEFQVRLEPLANPPGGAGPACGAVSLITAVAIRFNDGTIDGTTVSRRFDGDEIRVDGTLVDNAGALASALPENVILQKTDETLTFILDDGSRIQIGLRHASLTVAFYAADSRRDAIAGLLGTPSGTENDDFTLRDGTVLNSAPSFTELYSQFGQSWRVKSKAESLFPYAHGNNPNTFFTAGFPAMQARVENLSDAVRGAAEVKCKDVVGEPQHTWCVLDTACTGENFAPVYIGMASPGARMKPARRPVIVTGALVNQSTDSVAADDVVTDDASCRIPGAIDNAIFAEQFGRALTNPVTVDVDDPGEYNNVNQLQATTIAAGTPVDVWFIHIPQTTRQAPVFASARFAGEILGVAVKPTSLDASDSLGDPALTYPVADTGRGLELGTDSFTITPDGRELRLQLRPPADVDQLRVFVAAP